MFHRSGHPCIRWVGTKASGLEFMVPKTLQALRPVNGTSPPRTTPTRWCLGFRFPKVRSFACQLGVVALAHWEFLKVCRNFYDAVVESFEHCSDAILMVWNLSEMTGKPLWNSLRTFSMKHRWLEISRTSLGSSCGPVYKLFQ